MSMLNYLKGSTVYVAHTSDKHVTDIELFADEDAALAAASLFLAGELEQRAPESVGNVTLSLTTSVGARAVLEDLQDLAGNVYGIDSWASVESREIG